METLSVAGLTGAYPSPVSRQAGRGNNVTKRMRVTRACDRCKKRKIRCNGLQPCRLCVEASSRCTYDTAYSRGKLLRMPPRGDNQSQQSQQSELTDASSTISSNNYNNMIPSTRPTERASELPGSLPTQDDSTLSATEPGSRASPEPVQTDLDGHYVGPSSGVSFLLRVQKRLDQSVSFPQGSSIFTFGDAPLPHISPFHSELSYYDPTLFLMLSRDDTTRLVQRYFDFAVPVDRFLHQPTIEAWLEELYDSRCAMHNKEDAPARIAVLFMIFAVAQTHTSPKSSASGSDMSIRYFQAANHQLSREQGTVRLASVQARLCQCLWLLSESRINHCWSLFGTVTRLAYAIGLHRKRNADSTGRVEIECRRRTFWSAYALDNYLSTALGRPRTFHNEDIDQELPFCVNDLEIHDDRINQSVSRAQSIMFGPVAYAKLSRILSVILRNIYSIHPTSYSDRHAAAVKLTEELKSWRADVSHFLDPENIVAPLIPIFQRQKNVLNLAYWHTMILAHRPFLLRNFAQLRNPDRQRHHDSPSIKFQIEQSVAECLQAAMNIVSTVNDMFQAGQLFRAYWLTSYFAFSAAVILYIYTIQQSNDLENTYRSYFIAATHCQEQLSSLVADEEGSLVTRYCLVLKELRTEALRQTKYSTDIPPIDRRHEVQAFPTYDGATTTSTTRTIEPFLAATATPDNNDGSLHLVEPDDEADVSSFGGDFHITPTDSLAEITSWGHFDSMVSASGDGFQLMI